MKIGTCIFLSAVVLLLSLLKRELESNYAYAAQYGAKTKIVFQVFDDQQRPIENAEVCAGFYLNKPVGKNP